MKGKGGKEEGREGGEEEIDACTLLYLWRRLGKG
jgi:hypothetical protein